MSVIESCPLFRGFSKDALHRVEECSTTKTYPTGTFIFQGGEPADYLCILATGRVRLRVGQAGQVAYSLSQSGDVFGWSSMVKQPCYTLSAQSVSEATIIRIERLRLLRIFENDAASGVVFFQNLAELIGQRLFNSYKATVSVHGERSSLSYG